MSKRLFTFFSFIQQAAYLFGHLFFSIFPFVVFRELSDDGGSDLALCANEVHLPERSVQELIGELNRHLQADRKLVPCVYGKVEYKVKFTDIQYGQRAEEVFIHKMVNDCKQIRKFCLNSKT